MIRSIWICLVTLVIAATPWSDSFGQKNEFGFMLGASNYHGDLAYQIAPSETHPATGFFSRINLNPYWSWRNALTYGAISGSDENFEEYRLRNLSFHSHIWELSSVMELNYLPFGSNILSEDFSSYLFIGIAGFRFNPTVQVDGTVYDLQPLRTEGRSYNLIQISMPFGGGVKYNLNKNWVFGWEVGWRKTWTDYLDDVSTVYPDLEEQAQQYGDFSAQMSDRSVELDEVSAPLSTAGDQRGDPNLNDYYFFSTFSIAYRFTPIICWPKYKRGYLFK